MLGAGGVALIVAAIVALTTQSSSTPRKKPAPPPARLPPLAERYANKAMGASGELVAGWTAVRGQGLLRLADRSGRAVILIAAVRPQPLPQLLSSTLASVRRTYGRVVLRRGNGTKLGGLPSRSIVVYTRNRRHVPIRVLLAVAGGAHRAFVVEAFTARSAQLSELVGAQQALNALQLRG